MRNCTKIVISVVLAFMMLGTTVFADAATVIFSGTAEPNSLVGFMVVGADADTGALDRTDVHTTDIIKADASGNFSKTVEFDDAIIDEDTGELTNYKAVSNYELTAKVMDDIIRFSMFKTTPVVENGVLYVPIEETLELVGGSTVSYNYNEELKTYTGKANNGRFTIVMGKDTVEVDWVDIELPGIIKEIEGTNMMPAYAIKYLLKTGDVIYNPGKRYFSLTNGVMEPGFDWEADHISKKLDLLVDGDTRIVLNSVTNRDNLSPYDWRVDKTTITRSLDASEWGDVYTVENQDSGENEVAINIRRSIDGETIFANDHIGLFHFKARPVYTNDESGTASFNIALQRRSAGHDGILLYSTSLSQQVSLPYEIGVDEQEWKDYYFVADSGSSEMLDGSWIQIVPLGKPAKFEICDIQLWDFGLRADCAEKIALMQPNPGYKGIEDDHVWRQEAWNRIEKYRKEDISIEVTDADGNPVSGATVDVNMTDNEFMFGAAISENEVLDKYIDKATLRGQTLDSFMDNDMNVGVAADMLKAYGIRNNDAEVGIDMINEFISRGKRTRGHAIFWDDEGLMPFNRAKQMTYQEIYKQTMDYIRPLVYTFKGSLSQWDVLNEPHDSNYTRKKYNTTRLYTDIFKEVKKIDPEVKLYVNETGMEGRPFKGYSDRVPNFLNIVKQMQDEGAPIDGIGIQAHCVNYCYPQGIYHQIDECSKLVDEVAITEYDFYNGNMEYAPNHLEDTMLALFSHPKGSAFVVWNIEDSMHWRWNANAAPFFRRDWSAKPAYYMWKKMTEEVFATNETVETDAEGKASIRAFRGDYKITCTYNGKSNTVELGNTVEGGSSVRFIVGNSISAVASNPTRESLKTIEFNNMTEAKMELDSLSKPYYKSVILDRNFKGTENTDLVTDGGDIINNTEYQKGETWGSLNGMGELLYDGNWSSTIIHPNATVQTGDIRLRAEGTERYEGTELHHETMVYTLNSKASGEVKISTGLSTSGQSDVKLAEIVYKDGSYSVKAIDGHEIALEPDKLYTIDTAIVGDTVEYSVMLTDEVVAEYSCALSGEVDTAELTEVCYLFNANCAEDDIFMLHNARVYEYKDGEFIEISDTDYEAYLLDESMKSFDAGSIKYAGAALSEAPSEWTHIGSTASTVGFGYKSNGRYFGAVAHSPSVGEHSIAKGIGRLNDGESMEITFDAYIGSYDKFMDATGYGGISIGSHDKSVMLDIARLRYRQHDDENGRAYELWLINPDGSTTPAAKEIIDYESVFARDKTDVKFTLIPSEDGQSYDAQISIKPRTGSEEIIATSPSVFTAEQVKKIDTVFLSSYIDEDETIYENQMMFGIKDLCVYKYGNTMYHNGEASLADGESASLGIMYNNATGVYKPAMVVIAGYKDDVMTYCEVKDGMINPGEGGFGFNLEASAEVADYYKVFLMEGNGTIRPYKAEDLINISK